MQKLGEEDPTFKVSSDEETGQTIISGMGELHLEILVDRLKREFKVKANIGQPMVAYREAITKSVQDISTKFVRQSGGRGQYGHVVINVEPNEPGSGYVFNNITPMIIPSILAFGLTLIREIIKDIADNSKVMGYPAKNIRQFLKDNR